MGQRVAIFASGGTSEVPIGFIANPAPERGTFICVSAYRSEYCLANAFEAGIGGCVSRRCAASGAGDASVPPVVGVGVRVRGGPADTDWLTAHGGPLVTTGPPFRSGLFTTGLLRRARSLDAQVLRYENVLSVTGCAGGMGDEPLHSSQVLLHEPVASDGTAGAWDPQASMRATLRAQGAPYTERQGFLLADLGAFTFLAQASSPRAWTLADGVLTAPGSDRAYAAFGDPTWNHLVIQARFDRHGATAGVAVGVSGSSPVAQAVLAAVEDGALVLIRRTGGTDTELARAALTATDSPLDIEVTAFDDRIRAQVGQVTVEADRGPVREGRVALVSDGAAGFDRLAVDGLDLYQVPFTTSPLRFLRRAHRRDGTESPPRTRPTGWAHGRRARPPRSCQVTASPPRCSRRAACPQRRSFGHPSLSHLPLVIGPGTGTSGRGGHRRRGRPSLQRRRKLDVRSSPPPRYQLATTRSHLPSSAPAGRRRPATRRRPIKTRWRSHWRGERRHAVEVVPP